MGNFLAVLMALSLGGAAAIALGALLRQLTKTRYGAKWRCWLWLILCIRLLLPMDPLLDFGPKPVLLPIPEDAVLVEPVPEIPESPEPEASAPSEPAESRDPLSAPPHPSWEDNALPHIRPAIRLSDVLGLIWLTGVFITGLWAAASHLRFLRYLRRWSRPVTDTAILTQYQEILLLMDLSSAPQLRLCPGLPAPMLAGIFRQTILLPEAPMDSIQLRHTLLHELTHFRRKDIRLKTVALFVCCIHWFNPAVWGLSHMIAQDTELACDETLLRFLPKEEYASYCKTILHSVEEIHSQKGESQ